MKLLIAINRICYGSCLLAIISGAFLAVFSIWSEEHDVGWKGVATAGVLIFAAVLVLATNSLIGTKVMNEGGGVGELVPSGMRPGPVGPGRASGLASGLGVGGSDDTVG